MPTPIEVLDIFKGQGWAPVTPYQMPDMSPIGQPQGSQFPLGGSGPLGTPLFPQAQPASGGMGPTPPMMGWRDPMFEAGGGRGAGSPGGEPFGMDGPAGSGSWGAMLGLTSPIGSIMRAGAEALGLDLGSLGTDMSLAPTPYSGGFQSANAAQGPQGYGVPAPTTANPATWGGFNNGMAGAFGNGFGAPFGVDPAFGMAPDPNTGVGYGPY